jgi:UDP-N-acetylmuramoylalanine--D-glutamate ligase
MSAAAKKSSPTTELDLVYGLGVTGLSVARYMERNGIEARYVDSRDEPPGASELCELIADAETVFGKTPKKLLKRTSRIFVSPGIADNDAYLKAARKAGIEILSDIELFVRDADAPFVAITGSNGKSTVTTLLALMCESAGVTGYAGANLGMPALDLLTRDKPDFYLLELSSFQLQRTKNLPAKVAVLLNFSADHLDWHASVDEYRDAKYRIFAEAETAVINRDDDSIEQQLPEKMPRVSFGLDEPETDQYGLREEDGRLFLARGDQILLAVDDVSMVGAHNLENALAALAAGELIGLDVSSMLQVLNQFPGLPHRMQSVARVDGVDYINDSKATNVGASIASVRSLPGPVILIAGGQGKGGDFNQLATATCGQLRAAVLIGDDAPLLEAAFVDLTPTHCVADMQAAVAYAKGIAEVGDTVLLAPACASFDQYEGFAARGEDFCRIVEVL